MPLDAQNLLQQALTKSEQLLQLLKEGEMEQAVAVEAERFRLIRQGVAAGSPQDLRQSIDFLRQIEVLNREIESTGQQERLKLSAQLRQIRQGRKAGKAYRESR